MPEPARKELAEQEALHKKREKQREYARRACEKKKLKEQQAAAGN